MPNIQVLPQDITDKIAAGEVAERPSAVVKELVENSIDADATSIEIEIRKGGIEYIRISDNGCGIEPNQVETAFLRHATSKLKTIDDLYTDLQDYGLPNEDCRYILPNACTTCIEVKMNFRTLIHFMNERLCTRAQWEIRQMALLMKRCIEEQYPELAKYLVPKCEIHEGMPFCTEHKSCGRHPLLKDIYSGYWENMQEHQQ